MSRSTSDHQRCACAKAPSVSPLRSWEVKLQLKVEYGKQVWQSQSARLEIVRHQQSLRMSAVCNSGRVERRSIELKVEEEL